MRIYVQLAVYVVAFAIGHTASLAKERQDWVTDITPVSATAQSCEVDRLEFNGFDQYRSIPDEGPPCVGSYGFQHFNWPLHHYTSWYRPRAATLTRCVRCAEDPFRPRGLGHLFARPCDGYRMDYSPFVLCNDDSKYGPSYLARQPDPRCDDHCDHSSR